MTAERIGEPTPAQRRRDRQRRLIIREAGRLFEENGGEDGGGFEKTTAEAIAERSDISVSTFFRYFRTKADVIYLDLESAIEDQMSRVSGRLAAGQGLAEAWVEGTSESLERTIVDAVDKARVLRALRSPNFDAPRALWTGRWNDRLTELLRQYLPADRNQTFRARTTSTVWLYTQWAAIEQWAAVGLDQPLAPILRQAFGLAAVAAREAQDAMGDGSG